MHSSYAPSEILIDNSADMPLKETNQIAKSVDKSTLNPLDKSTKVGKENMPTIQESARKSIDSEESQIFFYPDITVYPMDSKIDFETAAVDEMPVFSPPTNNRARNDSANGPIPAFIRKLEPNMFAEIIESDRDSMQSQPSKKPRQEKTVVAGTFQVKSGNESVADSIVKHTLDTNHLHFPGRCIFVSLMW